MYLKTKLFLPIAPDGSLTLPSLLLEHLGITEDGLIGLFVPERPSPCNDCEELELSLSSVCEENLCKGYTSHEESINLPEDLLDAADLAAGTELTAICFGGGILITSSECAENTDSLEISPTEDILVLPLKTLSCLDE